MVLRIRKNHVLLGFIKDGAKGANLCGWMAMRKSQNTLQLCVNPIVAANHGPLAKRLRPGGTRGANKTQTGVGGAEAVVQNILREYFSLFLLLLFNYSEGG